MKRKSITILVLLIFLVGAAFAGYNIFTIAREYLSGDMLYSEVQQYISIPEAEPAAEPTDAHLSEAETQPPISETSSTDEELPEQTLGDTEPVEDPVVFPEVDFDALMQISDDVVAWVYIEGTNINYPVVQGEDNRFYVSAMINGVRNGAGSIFMDYHNQPDFTDPHTILYGHNMKNGSMFADISKYRNQEYYDEHPTGLIMTPEQNYRFEIVASYVASLADSAWQLEFFSDEDALQWLHDAMDRSGFTSSTVPELGDRIITLSTCSYEFNNARFVLVGVLR